MAQQTKNTGPITLKCDGSWDPCQKKQFCAKIKIMNERMKADGNQYWQKRPVTPEMSVQKATHQKAYRKANPPEQGQGDWTHDCAKADVASGKRQVEPDHTREVQLGGNVAGPFLWLDSEVNNKMGRDICNKTKKTKTRKNYRVTGFKGVCKPKCPK